MLVACPTGEFKFEFKQMCLKPPARTYTGTEPEFRGIPFRSVPFRPRGGRFRNIPSLDDRLAAPAKKKKKKKLFLFLLVRLGDCTDATADRPTTPRDHTD